MADNSYIRVSPQIRRYVKIEAAKLGVSMGEFVRLAIYRFQPQAKEMIEAEEKKAVPELPRARRRSGG